MLGDNRILGDANLKRDGGVELIENYDKKGAPQYPRERSLFN